ncbi:guanylyl cyclase-activating protein 3 [Dromiciops gliroides]|uniref:guanylyl cyclase-activating protein 3 n=1 Tax=Dromiciops gliroides TaxID=33562 RepID=UPI001CC638B9|nr:guanylyl cyclase-activating protein 3 [Dromiciops gliroides]XP_043851557.1 guanylyl cyclase-activating protein 3 [Dromiciops gliroides]
MKTVPKRRLLSPGISMGGKESVAGGQTVITAVQTHVWLRRFMTECPSGLQTLHEFKALLGLQGLNQRANQYVDQLFNIFDKNKDGFIDFLEFIAAINLVIQGKMDQKLKWYFKLYDADGNGSIDRKELLNIFMAIQAINGQNTLNVQEFANLVFEKIDVNNDGELTLEEFISGLEKDPKLLEMITKSFDLSNVLKVIQSGRKQDTRDSLP